MAETWKPCLGFEGFYEASDLGNIRSTRRGKLLKFSLDKDGYLRSVFSVHSMRKNVFAHKLIAEAFHGKCPNNLVVRHLDGNPLNNCPSNLTFGTPKENSEDMLKHNTQAKGSDCGNSKLSSEDVMEIRRLRNLGVSQADLCKQFGVTQANISFIISGKT